MSSGTVERTLIIGCFHGVDLPVFTDIDSLNLHIYEQGTFFHKNLFQLEENWRGKTKKAHGSGSRMLRSES